MAKFLGYNGVKRLWYKIVNYVTTYANITTTSVNGKLRALINIGESNIIPVTELSDIIDSTHKISADLIEDGTTNKVYTGTEQTKLSGIEGGAEVNQNAFSSVKVGNTTVAADSKTDTLELVAGTNISLSPDATNDKVTINVTGIADGAEVNLNAFSNVKVGATTIAADSKTDTLEIEAGSNITLTPDATNDKVAVALSESPALTGTPTAPTAGVGTNSTLIATTAFVKTAIDSKTVIHLIPSIAQMTADTTIMSGCTVYIESDSTLAANIIADVAAGKEVILEDTDGGLYYLSLSWADSGLCLFVLSNNNVGNNGTELSIISVFIISSTSASYTSYNICALQAETYDKLALDTFLALKAPLASPALTGTPTAPTATSGTNTTQIATTGFVQNELSQYELEKDYSKEYLTLVSLEDDNTIYWNGIIMDPSFEKTISVSTDNGTTWTEYTSSPSTILATLNTGDKLLVKGNNDAYGRPGSQSGPPGAVKFESTKTYNVEGNIMSLIYGDDFIDKNILTAGYTFYYLFGDQDKSYKVVNAKNLILPAKTLIDHCYGGMFYNCTLLTTAPELPATTLATQCYNAMFYNCTSLTTALELPATTLATSCYNAMFSGCSSLTAAPELPATTLAQSCYFAMFSGCTSLITAPELPATVLADGCYYLMFYNCASLNCIKCLATDISATNCTTGWVNGVASTGTFIKADSMSSWTTGVDGIPTGWTVVNESDYVDIKKYELPSLETDPTVPSWAKQPTKPTYNLDEVGDGATRKLSDKAPLASPALTGTPTAPTATAGTNTTLIATTAFVLDAIITAGIDSAKFQGTTSKADDYATALSTGEWKFSTLSSYTRGQYWVVASSGTYAGQVCESGDMIFCITDKGSSSYSASHFSAVQNNIIEMSTTDIDDAILDAENNS